MSWDASWAMRRMNDGWEGELGLRSHFLLPWRLVTWHWESHGADSASAGEG